MKKLITLLLSLTMVLSLAACGAGADNKPSEDSGKPSAGQQTETNNEKPDASSTEDAGETANTQNKAADLTTVEGYLWYWGELDLEQVFSDGITRAEKNSWNIETGEISSVGLYSAEVLSEAELDSCLIKMLNNCICMSDDGKVYNSGIMTDDKDQWTNDYLVAAREKGGWMLLLDGEFKKDGKDVGITIELYPDAVDKEDPDEANAVMVFSFEYR